MEIKQDPDYNDYQSPDAAKPTEGQTFVIEIKEEIKDELLLEYIHEDEKFSTLVTLDTKESEDGPVTLCVGDKDTEHYGANHDQQFISWHSSSNTPVYPDQPQTQPFRKSNRKRIKRRCCDCPGCKTSPPSEPRQKQNENQLRLKKIPFVLLTRIDTLSHTGKTPFRCRFKSCQFECIVKTTLIDHIGKAHGTFESPYEYSRCSAFAQLCYRDFQSESEFITKKHIKTAEYKCNHIGCEYTFMNSHQLEIHKQTHTYPYKCMYTGCKASFLKLRSLSHHIQIHTEVEGYKCDFSGCNCKFLHLHHLKMHKLTHIVDKPHKCNYTSCTASFIALRGLNEHVTSHAEDKLFKCGFTGCTSEFKRKANLKDHIRTHTGEKPFKCKIKGCGAAFADSSALATHRRIHTGHKPYVCDYAGCGSAFVQPSKLKRHQRKHSDAKSYKCHFDGCKSAFKYSWDLVDHIREHTGEKPYLCDFAGCETAFSSSCKLRNHKVAKHNRRIIRRKKN